MFSRYEYSLQGFIINALTKYYTLILVFNYQHGSSIICEYVLLYISLCLWSKYVFSFRCSFIYYLFCYCRYLGEKPSIFITVVFEIQFGWRSIQGYPSLNYCCGKQTNKQTSFLSFRILIIDIMFSLIICSNTNLHHPVLLLLLQQQQDKWTNPTMRVAVVCPLLF